MKKENQKFEYTILFDPVKCSGCKACELACSFKKTKSFAPENASLKVKHNVLERETDIEFFKSCDLCPGYEMPLCIEFCSTNALYIGRKQL